MSLLTQAPPFQARRFIEASTLKKEAQNVAKQLRRQSKKLVLAESCTGGLVGGYLAQVPGISDHFCGSAVVYRFQTKAKWLGLSLKRLRSDGAINAETAQKMASQVLRETPEAHLAASITGELEAQAENSREGFIYVSLAKHPHTRKNTQIPVHTEKIRLPGRETQKEQYRKNTLRQDRQLLASHFVLRMVRLLLESGR